MTQYHAEWFVIIHHDTVSGWVVYQNPSPHSGNLSGTQISITTQCKPWWHTNIRQCTFEAGSYTNMNHDT
ncbi:hypothetical protein CHS0354_022619, partial [Potamilus streckersoni]